MIITCQVHGPFAGSPTPADSDLGLRQLNPAVPIARGTGGGTTAMPALKNTHARALICCTSDVVHTCGTPTPIAVCRYHDFYEVTRRHIAMLPLFANSNYVRHKISSSVMVSMSTHVPMVFTEEELAAYSFLDESCVYLRVRRSRAHGRCTHTCAAGLQERRQGRQDASCQPCIMPAMHYANHASCQPCIMPTMPCFCASTSKGSSGTRASVCTPAARQRHSSHPAPAVCCIWLLGASIDHRWHGPLQQRC